MAGRIPQPVVLTEFQRTELERIIARDTSPQRLVRRASLILALSECQYIQAAANKVGVSRQTAHDWHQRWLAAQDRLSAVESSDGEKGLFSAVFELLSDVPGRGRKPKFSAEQVCEIVAVACERPQESKRPTSHWSQKELKAEVIKRKIVDDISVSSVGRFLKRG
ncbi:MAG: helix-turn-helix domain-containing protein [Planctomycetota bacterium]|jgi:putative transposase|nr:helix-turn-helix domain-containing protein [Planctomycetota bacterium]